MLAALLSLLIHPALASDHTVVRGRIEGFRLATCEATACYLVEAATARHGMSGGLSLDRVRVEITPKAPGSVRRELSGREGFFDSRTRSLVVRREGGRDCFVDFESADVRCF